MRYISPLSPFPPPRDARHEPLPACAPCLPPLSLVSQNVFLAVRARVRCRSPANEAELLASVRERYTTVKRLVVRPAPTAAPAGGKSGRNIVVEVQFTGPQPSEGPGALLCDLLHGTSVGAKPVELPRGRKKRARTDASSEASDSGEREPDVAVFFCACLVSHLRRRAVAVGDLSAIVLSMLRRTRRTCSWDCGSKISLMWVFQAFVGHPIFRPAVGRCFFARGYACAGLQSCPCRQRYIIYQQVLWAPSNKAPRERTLTRPPSSSLQKYTEYHVSRKIYSFNARQVPKKSSRST